MEEFNIMLIHVILKKYNAFDLHLMYRCVNVSIFHKTLQIVKKCKITFEKKEYLKTFDMKLYI